jgi:3-phenylpropionate/trans-cinnamate dioxygenase ferredoxin subunit
MMLGDDDEKKAEQGSVFPGGGVGVNWHKIEHLSASGLADHKLTEVNVVGKRIGLLKKNGKILAFAASCPHAGADLCDGWVDILGRIVCPAHKYRFDPVNGRNTSGEGYKLFTYATETREDEIFVAINNF